MPVKSCRKRAREQTKVRKPNFGREPMSHGWTPERRAKQAEAIHCWKPWQESTGPKSHEGKARVSRNGRKGGKRPMLRELARLLRDHPDTLEATHRLLAGRHIARFTIHSPPFIQVINENIRSFYVCCR